MELIGVLLTRGVSQAQPDINLEDVESTWLSG